MVRDGFVENAFVAEVEVVVLEAFEFDAGLVGDVFEFDGGEIGETCFGANACEFWVDVGDRVVPFGVGIHKGLDFCHFVSVYFTTLWNAFTSQALALSCLYLESSRFKSSRGLTAPFGAMKDPSAAVEPSGKII